MGKLSNLRKAIEQQRKLSAQHNTTASGIRADRVKNGPTEYFEAKFQGAAKLSDFAGAVVPEDTPADVIEALRNKGLTVETYDGTPEGRLAARSRIPGSVFMLPAAAGVAGLTAEDADAGVFDLVKAGERISTRYPTGTAANQMKHLGRIEDPIAQNLIINTDVMRETPKLFEHNARLVGTYNPVRTRARKPESRLDAFMDATIDNLLFLHDKMPEDVRGIAKEWYHGANRMAQRLADDYGVTLEQAAAVMASLSPQKDWYQNASLARRVAEIHQQVQGGSNYRRADRLHMEMAQELYSDPKYAKDLEALRTRDYEQLSGEQKAMFIRSFDQAFNDRGYDIVAPTGESMGRKMLGNNEDSNEPPKPAVAAWGSNSEIAKAISVLEDGSAENISRRMGGAHKVRNFYNNIVNPDAADGDVTVDTHAVAAGLLKPLSGTSAEVTQNFGGGPKGGAKSASTNLTGAQGTYGFWADAYRKAAEARGILPREMQSITWEAVRGLFPAKWKTEANAAEVEAIWNDYKRGRLTRSQAQDAIFGLRGMDEPDWVERSDSGVLVPPGANSDPGAILRPGVPPAADYRGGAQPYSGNPAESGRPGNLLGRPGAPIARPSAQDLAYMSRNQGRINPFPGSQRGAATPAALAAAGGVAALGSQDAEAGTLSLANRLARAREQGFDVEAPVYHSTKGDFPAFRQDAGVSRRGSDFGFHFGSKEAAEDAILPSFVRRYNEQLIADPDTTPEVRARAQKELENYYSGANIIPAYVKKGKTVRLPDFGRWDSPSNAGSVLADQGWYSGPPRIKPDLETDDPELAAELLDIASNTSDKDEWKQKFRSALEKRGYDSVVYKNTIEGDGDSIMLINPEDIRSVNAKFDPANIGKNDLMGNIDPKLLAALAGGAGAAALASDDAEAGALDLAKAARMQRAREQGFDTDRTFYHGANEWIGEQIDPSMFGEGQSFMSGEAAFFLTDSPDVADTYLGQSYVNPNSPDLADYAGGISEPGTTARKVYEDEAQLIPAYVNYQDYDVWDFGGGPHKPETVKAAIEEAKQEGKKGVVFTNMSDPGLFHYGRAKPSNIVAVIDPGTVRSVNARFDPENAGRADIMGSATPAALAAAGGGAAAAGLLGTQATDSTAYPAPWVEQDDLIDQALAVTDNPAVNFAQRRARRGSTRGQQALQAYATLGSSLVGGLAGGLSKLGGAINPLISAEDSAAGAEALAQRLTYQPSEPNPFLDELGRATDQLTQQIESATESLPLEQLGELYKRLPGRARLAIEGVLDTIF